jgi:peptidylprolyl isomerase
MAHVRAGDVVQIRYTGLAANGTAFGTSEIGEPLQFNVNSEQVIEGLKLAVLGMQAGEKKTVTVPPEQGFGPRLPERVYQVRRATLPEHVQVGDRLRGFSGEQVIPVWVVALENDSATMDANHPLAGQTVVLQIELVAIQPQGRPTGMSPKATLNRPLAQTSVGVSPGGPAGRGRRPPPMFRRRR